MRKIVYVGFAFQHHKNTHAGYHQIKKYVKYDYFIDCQSFFNKCSIIKQNLFGKIKRHILWNTIQTLEIPWYILKCIILGLKHNDLTFHFIYGENIYFNFRHFIRSGNKLVCTIHQPYNFFIENPKALRRLKSLDAIILVANNEISKFKSIKDKVYYIPHGIDTDFYNIDRTVKKEKIVLTVGNWLRDYNFASKLYEQLLSYRKDLKIIIVSLPQNKRYFDNNKEITFLSNISDKQLHELYCKSSILFLPLIRYTANNSLLEAASSGCNILIASNYQDNSYIPNEYINICQLDIPTVLENIENTISDKYNEKISYFVKDNYSWKLVGEETQKLLISI